MTPPIRPDSPDEHDSIFDEVRRRVSGFAPSAAEASATRGPRGRFRPTTRQKVADVGRQAASGLAEAGVAVMDVPSMLRILSLGGTGSAMPSLATSVIIADALLDPRNNDWPPAKAIQALDRGVQDTRETLDAFYGRPTTQAGRLARLGGITVGMLALGEALPRGTAPLRRGGARMLEDARSSSPSPWMSPVDTDLLRRIEANNLPAAQRSFLDDLAGSATESGGNEAYKASKDMTESFLDRLGLTKKPVRRGGEAPPGGGDYLHPGDYQAVPNRIKQHFDAPGDQDAGMMEYFADRNTIRSEGFDPGSYDAESGFYTKKLDKPWDVVGGGEKPPLPPELDIRPSESLGDWIERINKYNEEHGYPGTRGKEFEYRIPMDEPPLEGDIPGISEMGYTAPPGAVPPLGPSLLDRMEDLSKKAEDVLNQHNDWVTSSDINGVIARPPAEMSGNPEVQSQLFNRLQSLVRHDEYGNLPKVEEIGREFSKMPPLHRGSFINRAMGLGELESDLQDFFAPPSAQDFTSYLIGPSRPPFKRML